VEAANDHVVATEKLKVVLLPFYVHGVAYSLAFVEYYIFTDLHLSFALSVHVKQVYFQLHTLLSL
jgi:hypothetical protein